MLNANTYKPRYKLSGKFKAHIWPYKNGRLRGFVLIRKRRRRRGGHYRRLIMVHNTRKWREARRFFRYSMFDRKIRKRSRGARRHRYNDRFNLKRKFRNFYGKIREQSFKNIFQRSQKSSSKLAYSFYARLESRLERIIYRLHYTPTIFAANQLIHYHGIEVNQRLNNNPRSLLLPGDIVSPGQHQWKIFFINLLKQVFYREWGLYVRKRRHARRYIKYRSKLNTYKRDWIRTFRKYYKDNKKTLVYLSKIRPFIFNKVFKGNKLSQKLSPEQYSFYSGFKKALSNTVVLNKRKSVKRKMGKTKKKKYKRVLFFSVNKGVTQKMFFVKRSFIKSPTPLKQQNQKNTIHRKKYIRSISGFKRPLSPVTFYHRIKWRESFIKRVRKNNSSGVFLRKKINHFFASLFRKQIIEWKRPRRRPFYGYFISLWRKRRKARRRKKFTRLRKVHWYIPAYLYFDPLRSCGTLLHIPRSEEIYYSTHVSLHSVYSFYRSRGF